MKSYLNHRTSRPLAVLSLLLSSCLAPAEQADSGDDPDALAQTEQALYWNDPAMVARWKGDDALEVLSGQPLALAGGAEANAPGKFDGGFRLDNQDAYLEVTEKAAFNVGAGDFSVTLWLKTSDDGSFRTFLDNRQQDGLRGYSLWLDQGALGVQLATGGSENFATEATVADGRWHHIAMSVARSDPTGLRIFIDGFPVKVFDPTSQQGDLNNPSPLRIGTRFSEPPEPSVEGSYDEIAIWSKALSAHEVMTEASKTTLHFSGFDYPEPERPFQACSGFAAEAAFSQWKLTRLDYQAGVLRDWVCSDNVQIHYSDLAANIIKSFDTNESLWEFRARRCDENRWYPSSTVTAELLGPAMGLLAPARAAWNACMAENTDGFYCEPERVGAGVKTTLHWETTFGPSSVNLTYDLTDVTSSEPLPTSMLQGTQSVLVQPKAGATFPWFTVYASASSSEPIPSSFEASCDLLLAEPSTPFVPCATDLMHLRLDRVKIERGGDALGKSDNQWSICYGAGTSENFTRCLQSSIVKGPTASGSGQIDQQLGETLAMDQLVAHGAGQCFQIKTAVWDNDRPFGFYVKAEDVEAVSTYCWDDAQKRWAESVKPTRGSTQVGAGYLEGTNTSRFRAKAWWSVERQLACVP